MSNEITAFFKGRVGVCESLYRYDFGMVMVLDGVMFGTVFDAYYSTTGEEDAIPVIGKYNRVAIPDSCLQKPGIVTLHIPIHEGQNDSEVEYIVTFKVIDRARPIYEGTPKESTAIAKALAVLQDIQGDVSTWLDQHPEATSTVQDGSLTMVKFSNLLKLQAIKDYVTPQMYGAVGDGETDDSDAFIEALSEAPVVLVPHGNYKITKQIEITNKHRLLAIGTVRIYTSVANNYAFYIHGNEDDDYESTNYYYDHFKGVWFGGVSGGITIINQGGTNGILFGTVTYPSSTIMGENATGKIANVGIWNYNVGIKITNYNNYLNTFERIHFERCGECVIFGDTDTTKMNSGENFQFINCVFATSDAAVRFYSGGWVTYFDGCSIDFCKIAFHDSFYSKVFFTNGHIEGIGKRSASDTLYGIAVNIHAKSMFVFAKTMFVFDNISKGINMFKGNEGTIVIDSCYLSTAMRYPEIPDNPFLSEQKIHLIGTLFGQEFFRPFLSAKNNLVPDSLLSSATSGTIEVGDITDDIKLFWKAGCTAQVVNGSMFSNQKVIRFDGTGVAPMNATIKVTIPVEPLKTYNLALATKKHTASNMYRSIRADFFDNAGNVLSESSSYLWQPDEPPVDEIFFPFIGRKIDAPAGAAYMEARYAVAVTPDASALEVGEYIEVDYMYCEEW